MCDSRWRLVYWQAYPADRAVRDVDYVQALLTPYPADEMIAYPVSTRVNNPAYDAPECIAPLT